MRVLLLSAIVAACAVFAASIGSIGISLATSSVAEAQPRPSFERCLKRCLGKGHNEYACRNRCIRK